MCVYQKIKKLNILGFYKFNKLNHYFKLYFRRLVKENLENKFFLNKKKNKDYKQKIKQADNLQLYF